MLLLGRHQFCPKIAYPVFCNALALFRGSIASLWTKTSPYTAQLQKGASGGIEKIEAQLHKMVSLGIIILDPTATAWTLSSIHPRKVNGTIHLCLDLMDLNKVIIHKQPMLKEVYNRLADLKVF